MRLSYFKEHFGQIADFASVVGLLSTLGGFFVTIWNVRKAKQAAEEARQAAREAFSRIKSQLLVIEIEGALQLIRRIDSSCRGKKWGDVLSRCDEYRAQVARIKENDKLSLDERQALSASIKTIGDLLPYVRSIRDKKLNRSVSATMHGDLHLVITLLGEIQGRLQSQNMELK